MYFHSSTKQFELTRDERKQMWENRHELRDEYGIRVQDVFDMEGKEEQEPLSFEPLYQLGEVLVWSYSTPLRAVVTSIGIAAVAVHFGYLAIPSIVFLATKWIGVGMVVGSSAVLTKELIIKINGKRVN